LAKRSIHTSEPWPQDLEDRHQQHPPLGEAEATTHPGVQERLEKTDQGACSCRRDGGWEAKGQIRFSRTTPQAPRLSREEWDGLLIGLAARTAAA